MLVEVNVVAGEQIIGHGFNTKPHWVRSGNIQVIVPANEEGTLCALVLSSNVGKVAEILVAEAAESLAGRLEEAISPAPPVSRSSILKPSLIVKPEVHV